MNATTLTSLVMDLWIVCGIRICGIFELDGIMCINNHIRDKCNQIQAKNIV